MKWGVLGGAFLVLIFLFLLIPNEKVKWILASLVVTFLPYLFIKERSLRDVTTAQGSSEDHCAGQGS